MKLFDFINRLSDIFLNNGVRPCVLRNYGLLPQENIGNDIDFLFPEVTFRLIQDAVNRIPGVTITGFCDRYYVLSVFLYNVEWGQKNVTIQVDFFRHLCWKGLPYIDADRILEHSIPLGSECNWIYRPQPYHEAIVTLFSSYLVGGWVKDRYQEMVRFVFNSHSHETLITLCDKFPSELSKKIIGSVTADDRAALLAYLKPLRINLAWYAFKKSPRVMAFRIWRYYKDELINLFLPNRLRVNICVLGPDGSGKTTLIEALSLRLKNAAKNIDYIHFKPSFRRSTLDKKPVINPHGEKPRLIFSTIVKLLYFVCLYNFDGWLFPNSSRNFSLRIWDRYYHDMLADPKRYRIGAPAWLVRLFGRLIPKPDLFLILDVAPEVARARKAEVSEKECLRQFHAYRALARELPNAVLVDANAAPDAVAAECERAIVEVMSLRVQGRGVAS